MSSCGQDSRVFSATVNEVKKIDVSGDTKPAISHGGCYHLSHHQRKSTKRIDKEFRQSALSRQVGCWIFERKLPATFFCALTKVSSNLRFNFPFSFSNQNPQRKSATISHKEFQELNFKQAKFGAQKKKKKKVMVEMGILGDFL